MSNVFVLGHWFPPPETVIFRLLSDQVLHIFQINSKRMLWTSLLDYCFERRINLQKFLDFSWGVCVALFYWTDIGESLQSRGHSLNQGTWGGRILTLHLNYVAGYTGVTPFCKTKIAKTSPKLESLVRLTFLVLGSKKLMSENTDLKKLNLKHAKISKKICDKKWFLHLASWSFLSFFFF